MTLFDNHKGLFAVHVTAIGASIKNKIYKKKSAFCLSRYLAARERRNKENSIFYTPQACGAFCLLLCPGEK